MFWEKWWKNSWWLSSSNISHISDNLWTVWFLERSICPNLFRHQRWKWIQISSQWWEGRGNMFGHKQWHQSMITLWTIEIDTKHDSLEKDTSLFNFSYIYIYSWTYYSAYDLSNIRSTQKVKTQDVSNCEHSPAKNQPTYRLRCFKKKHRAKIGIHRAKTQKKWHYQSPFNTWTYSEGISTYGKSGKINLPIGSIGTGIFTVSVGKYTIDGSYGL